MTHNVGPFCKSKTVCARRAKLCPHKKQTTTVGKEVTVVVDAAALDANKAYTMDDLLEMEEDEEAEVGLLEAKRRPRNRDDDSDIVVANGTMAVGDGRSSLGLLLQAFSLLRYTSWTLAHQAMRSQIQNALKAADISLLLIVRLLNLLPYWRNKRRKAPRRSPLLMRRRWHCRMTSLSSIGTTTRIDRK